MNKYKTFRSRFFAAIADMIILSLLAFAFSYIINLFFTESEITRAIDSAYESSFNLAYFIFLHGKYGQSIGKMIMNVKIVSFPDESPITYKKAILRDLPYLILIGLDFLLSCLVQIAPSISGNFIISAIGILASYAAIIWFIIEIAAMLTDERRRAINDKIAGTVVIDLEAELKIAEIENTTTNG
jgi:uncharacterized RDD family membrane protein YckC